MRTMKPIQLFDSPSATYTYLVFDETTREAIIIDPVDVQLERDLAKIASSIAVEVHRHIQLETFGDKITIAIRLPK